MDSIDEFWSHSWQSIWFFKAESRNPAFRMFRIWKDPHILPSPWNPSRPQPPNNLELSQPHNLSETWKGSPGLASSRIKLWGESREPSLSAPSPKASKASAQTWQSFGSPVRALNCWGHFGDLAWALVEVAVLEPYTFNLFVLGLTVRFSSCRTLRAPERPPRL